MNLDILDEPARMSDLTTFCTPGELGSQTLIACHPKSGSTFVLSALSSLCDLTVANGSFAYGGNDHQPYLPYIVSHARNNAIYQEHYRATIGTKQIAEAFNFKVIVLVRDIFDALVSMRDMLASGDGDVSVMTEFESYMAEMTDEQQLDATIARYANWYVEFLVSWQQVAAKGRVPCRFVSYAEVMADKVGCLGDLAEFATGARPAPERIDAIVAELEGDKDKIRYNKGRGGRGRELMNERQVDYIRSVGALYPGADLSSIGL